MAGALGLKLALALDLGDFHAEPLDLRVETLDLGPGVRGLVADLILEYRLLLLYRLENRCVAAGAGGVGLFADDPEEHLILADAVAFRDQKLGDHSGTRRDDPDDAARRRHQSLHCLLARISRECGVNDGDGDDRHETCRKQGMRQRHNPDRLAESSFVLSPKDVLSK